MSRHERLTPDSTKLDDPTAEAPRKGSRKKVIFGLVGLIALGVGGWQGTQYWTAGRFMETTDDAYVAADVTLVSSRVQGYVATVSVGSNDHVSAGDILVRLDDGDYRNALATSQSRFATAGDTLARIDAQIAAARAGVAQAEAARDTADAQLRTARTNADRTEKLASNKVTSQAALDTATEDLDVARAGLASAEAAIASAEAQVAVLQAERAESEGQRRELGIAVDQARRDLDLTVLRAPADGIVANMTLEVGDMVAPGARLAALIPDGSLFVEANLKETQMAGVGPGALVEMSFDALPGQTFEGRVDSVAPATGAVFSLLPADNATGNFTKIIQRIPIRISLPEAALATGQLRAGLSTEISIDTRTTPTPGTATVAALSE
ncbi:HlyD family secretion protein [Puniceibacterium sediminis]|uniref:Membrane fusion protein, multidrug efflux system n=1 Tax=Puniceibacterium sediminis TaxID=1608407 RepID=A0A238YEE2_9RHOB|nr:HlyD family secretion protein [Puniceibacterium sediminis]SNR69430.1 membrane fusion protein, multidrug efflux system [Puniceibacterium sediminis]